MSADVKIPIVAELYCGARPSSMAKSNPDHYIDGD